DRIVEVDTPKGLFRPRLLHRGAKRANNRVHGEEASVCFEVGEVDDVRLDPRVTGRRAPGQHDDARDQWVRLELLQYFLADKTRRSGEEYRTPADTLSGL